jgi:hypothetical protein
MTHHHIVGEKQVGLIIGASMGLIKSFISLYTDIMETILLSAIGAIVGFLVTSFLQWAKKKLK